MDDKRKLGAVVVIAVLLLLMLALALAAGGCGIGTGPTQTFTIDEKPGGAAVTDVNVSMGAGKLNIGSGAAGLVSGSVQYNVERWKPEIVRTDSSVSIKQGTSKTLSGASTHVVNTWDLKLGSSPMRLSVSAGAYEGVYDLGGLSLQKLAIKDGASKTHVDFSTPNLTQMESLTYETGASTVTLSGLANADFKTMEFKGGAGTYTLDFSGELRTSGSVTVSAGVSSLRIVVPGGTAAKVVVDGKLTNVEQEGTWTANGKTYSTGAAASAGGELLTITVNMDVGNLRLTAS